MYEQEERNNYKLQCRDCPYGKSDFDIAMNYYNKTVEKHGIPNNIYGYQTYEDAGAEAEEYVYCDKVGGKIIYYGHCSDFDSRAPQLKNTSRKKKKNKRERDQKYKQHLKLLYQINEYWWPRPVSHVAGDKDYYKRKCPNHGGKYRRFNKKESNKRVRRYCEEIPNGASYKRIFNYYDWD